MRRLAFLSVVATLAGAPAFAQTPSLSFGLGQTESDSTAMFMNWHSAPRPAGWSYAAGLYATTQGAAWVGAGLSYTLRPGNGNFFLRGTVMPGLYHRGSDIDLGGVFEISTSIEIGTRLRNDAEIALMLLHRSNAGVYSTNPGLNTLGVSYTIPLH